jgi:hypothetical protein
VRRGGDSRIWAACLLQFLAGVWGLWIGFGRLCIWRQDTTLITLCMVFPEVEMGLYIRMYMVLIPRLLTWVRKGMNKLEIKLIFIYLLTSV